jgi:Ca2+:H+ antiporter
MAVALASLIIPATLCATLQSTELEAGTHILRLSRGTAIILIIIYFVYVYLQLRSHTYLFDIEQNESIEAEEDELDLQIGPVAAVTISILLAIGIGVCAVYLIDSIKSITKTQETSKKFIGFVVLPWVGRTKLLPFAILTVHRNNTGPVIDAAIKNSVHIAFFITPFTVIFGWVIGQDMTLHFQNYDIIVFFLCVMLVNYLVRDGKNRYLVSAICIGM